MTAGNAILIVAIVTGLGLIGALFFVMFKIRQISREFFGTSSLIEGLKRQEALEDDTPKSVSGMTRVELPRIEKDFPEFHWPEWKQRCENQLKGYLEALEHQDLSYLGKVSVSLKDQVRLKIEEMEEKEIREEFDAIHVHQTEISRYDKDPGKCRIRIQSAVEYLHTLKTPDKKKMWSRKKNSTASIWSWSTSRISQRYALARLLLVSIVPTAAHRLPVLAIASAHTAAAPWNR